MIDDGLADQEGEGYFASVSDLMVGVLFVFLLMLTVFALNFHDESAVLDASKVELDIERRKAMEAKHDADVARLAAEADRRAAEAATILARQLKARNESILVKLREAATALERELRDRETVRAGLLRRLASRLDESGIRFVLDQQSGVLRLSDAVPFGTSRSDLSEPIARQTVDVLAKVLSDVLPCFASGTNRTGCEPGDTSILETMLVEGHTDDQQYTTLKPEQSKAENDRLSTARALTVFAALRQKQPSLDLMKNPSGQPLLGVSGYGERRPLPGGEQKGNRRIDLRFVLSSRNSDDLQKLLKDINAITEINGP